MNGDGKLDFLVTSSASSTSTTLTVSYLPGDGKGGFGRAMFYGDLPSAIRVLDSGDFNHDGRLDIDLVSVHD